MPEFVYKSLSAAGELQSGTITAYNQEEALSMVRENAQYPISIVPAAQTVKVGSGKKVKIRNLTIFFKQFHTMLRAGVSILKAIDILRQQTEDKIMRQTLEKVFVEIQTGLTLSAAMRQFPHAFPDFAVNLTASGELTGNLDGVMGRLAEHYDKETKIKNKIIAALVYPAVMFVITVAVCAGLIVFVLPEFTDMYAQAGQSLPGITNVMIGLSDFITERWYAVLAFIVALIALIMALGRTKIIRLWFDRYRFRMPLFGKLTLKTTTARFARTLATLMAAGIALVTALEIASSVLGNLYVSAKIDEGIEDIKKGTELSSVVKQMNIFPPMLDYMIRIGEESGMVDDVLEKTADIYDEEVDAAISMMTAAMEPLLIVIMSGVIGTVVISIALPIFNMASAM